MAELKPDALLPAGKDLHETKEVSFSRKKFDQIKQKIEFPEVSRPKIEISDFGLEQLGQLSNNLDRFIEPTSGESKEKGIIAIVRCWNKNREDLNKFLSNIREVKKNMPNLQGVFLMINQEEEEEDKTEKNLQEIFKEESNGFPIVPIKVKGYSWTSGFNSAIAISKELIEEKKIEPKKIMIMPYSFDTYVPDEELKKCQKLIDEGHRFFLTFRLDPGGFHPMSKWDRGTGIRTPPPNEEEIRKRFIDLIRSPQAQKFSQLVYSMRNTFNLIPLDLLIDYGGFNPLCNANQYEIDLPRVGVSLGSQRPKPEYFKIPGMEDVEFFYRVVNNSLDLIGSREPEERIKGRKELRDFMRSFKNPISYSDESWDNRPLSDIIDKTADETHAFNSILFGLSSLARVRRINNPEEKIFNVRLGQNREIPEVIQDFRI